MTASRLAWALWALAVVLVLPGPVLNLILNWAGPGDIPYAVGFAAVELGMASAGAVVASRLPRNAVGWIFLAIGVLLGLALTVDGYGETGLHTRSGPLPGDEYAAWLGSWLFIPTVFALPGFLPLLFPTGRFLSPRWRWVGLAFGAAVSLATVATALKPGRIFQGDDENFGIPNPVALGGSAGEAIEVLGPVTDFLALPGFAVAVACLVVRLRRARGAERQALKGFAYAAALVAGGLGAGVLVSGGVVADLAFLVGLLALAWLPIAAGIAILRHGLYDIDLVINRTLVYAALTATLVGGYLASVLLLQLVLSPLTKENNVAVAGSTLAVAALFRPARARIQAIVDRRFYRHRYDAARTLEGFNTRLREELDLDALSTELRGVVGQTMQPAHVSLWLRPSR